MPSDKRPLLEEDLSGDDVTLVTESRPQSAFDTQILQQRGWIFKAALGICAVLYLLFIAFIIAILFSDAMLVAFLAHKHLSAVLLAMLIVPSFILWGIVRSVYHTGTEENEGIIKQLRDILKMHPSGS